jgi:hypothetical protein
MTGTQETVNQTKELEGHGHKLHMDNSFSSPNLSMISQTESQLLLEKPSKK